MHTDEMITYLESQGYTITSPPTGGKVQFHARAIVNALKEDYRRYVYKGSDGFCYIAYSGGLGPLFIRPSEVMKMVEQETLIDRHPDRKGEYLILQHNAYDKALSEG